MDGLLARPGHACTWMSHPSCMISKVPLPLHPQSWHTVDLNPHRIGEAHGTEEPSSVRIGLHRALRSGQQGAVYGTTSRRPLAPRPHAYADPGGASPRSDRRPTRRELPDCPPPSEDQSPPRSMTHVDLSLRRRQELLAKVRHPVGVGRENGIVRSHPSHCHSS